MPSIRDLIDDKKLSSGKLLNCETTRPSRSSGGGYGIGRMQRMPREVLKDMNALSSHPELWSRSADDHSGGSDNQRLSRREVL